jgi:hypothetical protein
MMCPHRGTFTLRIRYFYARREIPFLITGLLGAATIGFSFYPLFQLQSDEPRCWAPSVVECQEEW